MSSPTEYTDRQERIKQGFEEEMGYWRESFDPVLEEDPKFFDRYRELAGHPRSNGALERKVEEFVHVALNAGVTHLHVDNVRHHVGRALDEGATVDEVMEVLQMASVLGVHSITSGVRALDDEIGLSTDSDVDREEIEQLRAEFEERRETTADAWTPIIESDPEFFERYMEYSAHPWERGALDPKVREFVYVAIDVSTTHLHERGLRAHIRNAYEQGATRDELIAVFQLAAGLGFDTMTESVPVLIEEARARNRL